MKNIEAKPTLVEFSRPFNTERLQMDVRTENISANESELAALKSRFGLQDLTALAAQVRLQRMPDEPAVVMVTGRVTGAAVQRCVATLEPVPENVAEDFETLFAPPAYVDRWLKDHGEDDLDAPEPLDNGYLDLGELVAQYFSLALNPYPRKADAPYHDEETVAESSDNPNPFAVLAVLKDKK